MVAANQTNGGLLKDTSRSVLQLGRDVKPGKSHWRKLDPPLMNHTQAPETEAMYTLQVWPNPPNNEEATHQGQIFKCIQKEWLAHIVGIRKVAAAGAEEAEKGDKDEVNKDDNKQTKPKPKQSTCHSKQKKKDTSSKRIGPPDDNLNEYFGLSQRVRTVRKPLMLHRLTLQRSQRKPN